MLEKWTIPQSTLKTISAIISNGSEYPELNTNDPKICIMELLLSQVSACPSINVAYPNTAKLLVTTAPPTTNGTTNENQLRFLSRFKATLSYFNFINV